MHFETHLKNLEKEASLVKDSLNKSSQNILSIEKMLTLHGTNFLHKFVLYSINGDPKTVSSVPANFYIPGGASLEGSFDRTVTVLSWEPCESAKRYRLFFIRNKQTIYFFDGVDGDFERNIHEEVIFKKPFIETKLDVRLSHIKYLIPFMSTFKDALADYKASLNSKK